MAIQPFSINIPQTTLDDLRDRLARTRWPDEVEGAGWDYGVNRAYLRDLVGYWQHEFDWRAQEAQLNRLAQFRAEVDGCGIHFVHERGRGANPLPLLLLHGWPDSFHRMYKIIPLLTDPARYGGDPADSFDVIVPSLSGFGFSDRPQQRGGGHDATLFPKLMSEVLGYQRYGIHGGDTGSPIAQSMAATHPASVVGIHLTDLGWHHTLSADAPDCTPAERAYVESIAQWWSQHGAYAMVQGTMPQTLAYGIHDSPVGLAAWIIQQFRTLSDCGGDLERRFTKDELLTNIMIYWVTETFNASIRGYYEGMHGSWEESEQGAPHDPVPVGLALFPKDNPPPRELAARLLHVQHWTEMPRGGHFAALEEPELLVEDLRTFFRPFR